MDICRGEVPGARKVGAWICIAGVDGAGKSVQADILAKRLSDAAYSTFVCRGKEQFAWRVLRAVAHQRGMHSASELHAYFGHESTNLALALDDLHGYTRAFAPLRANGAIVIEPRSPYGRLAQAITLGGTNLEQMERVLFFAGTPDLTFWLDVSPEIALERIDRRGIDSESPDYITRLDAAHRQLSERYPWTRIDGSRSVGEIHEQIWDALVEWRARTDAFLQRTGRADTALESLEAGEGALASLR